MRQFTLLFVCLFISIFLISLRSQGGIGDTTVVQAHQAVHMNWNGNFDQLAFFPAAGTGYGKVLMKYTLGCPPTGCSPWDYTTQVFAEIETGAIDSTLTRYPDFTVDGLTLDSFPFNTNPVYTYFFNVNTSQTDSVIAPELEIHLYNDPLDPAMATDSFLVFPGNFYNYLYDASANIIDSIYVGADSLWYINYTDVYTPFNVTELFELARVMTPYANGYPLNWTRDYIFDVTDYQVFLKDTINIRVRYDGWSDGFTASVVFYFIEGTPPRNISRVRNIYPNAYYEYGITTNPIENHLIAKTFDILPSESEALIRVIPSGHSFGGPQNCAEFCVKNYRLFIDGTQRFQQQVWRNDCGMNPLMGQPGTWLYDRSNWCPGDRALWREHELTPYIVPGDSVTIDMNFDPYTYTSGAGFNPGYILNTHLITYDTINFITNAAIEEIIAPNKDFNYSRFNPICNNPVIVIKNYGSAPLTSATIHYGIKGGVQQTYNWSGNLNFNASETVTLGNLVWGSSTATPDVFEAWISSPNGIPDEYAYNDTLRSQTAFTIQMPSQFALLWKTNSAASETTYQLKDDQGNLLYSNGTLTANTIYRDTFNLSPGCYQLKISDSGKDGLEFFANNDGTGFARCVRTNGTAQILQNFNSDFGTSVTFNFTVGYMTPVQEYYPETKMNISPNPSSGNFALDLILPVENDIRISVVNQLGEVIMIDEYKNFLQDILNISLPESIPGMYFIKVEGKGISLTKKLVVQ